MAEHRTESSTSAPIFKRTLLINRFRKRVFTHTLFIFWQKNVFIQLYIVGLIDSKPAISRLKLLLCIFIFPYILEGNVIQ